MVPSVSPEGINAISTELSKPPPDIDSSPVPSGRQRADPGTFSFQRITFFFFDVKPAPCISHVEPAIGTHKGPLSVAAL